MNSAMSHLGVSENNVQHFNFPVREFPKHRQEILEQLIVLRKEIDPDLVLIPASFDIHQDHQIIHNEGSRAFKGSNLLGYELPWNNISSNINFHVVLSEEDILAKEKAAAAYASQGSRPYTKSGFFRSLATVRGVQTTAIFAEGFELLKWRT